MHRYRRREVKDKAIYWLSLRSSGYYLWIRIFCLIIRSTYHNTLKISFGRKGMKLEGQYTPLYRPISMVYPYQTTKLVTGELEERFHGPHGLSFVKKWWFHLRALDLRCRLQLASSSSLRLNLASMWRPDFNEIRRLMASRLTATRPGSDGRLAYCRIWTATVTS